MEKLTIQERSAREELLLIKANSESTSTSQAQEMITQFMKKTDELQLAQQLSDLKLDLKERDLKIREIERDLDTK